MISTKEIIAMAKEYSTEGGKAKGSFKEDLAFTAGAMWARKVVLEDACKWFQENAKNYIMNIGGRYERNLIVGGQCWVDFFKAMEE